MADQFQYLKLPDGSYGKFSADASPEDMRSAVERQFPEAYTPKTGAVPGGNTGVPAVLSGPQAPEYKPFGSSDEARDEASGLLKAGTSAIASPIAHMASHIPGAVGHVQAQSAKDFDNYAQPANKGETFGKVAGTAGLLLPALYGGGEFAGGLADELAPTMGPAISSAAAPLGRMALGAAKGIGKGALFGTGAGATYAIEHAVADKLKEFLK